MKEINKKTANLEIEAKKLNIEYDVDYVSEIEKKRKLVELYKKKVVRNPKYPRIEANREC